MRKKSLLLFECLALLCIGTSSLLADTVLSASEAYCTPSCAFQSSDPSWCKNCPRPPKKEY